MDKATFIFYKLAQQMDLSVAQNITQKATEKSTVKAPGMVPLKKPSSMPTPKLPNPAQQQQDTANTTISNTALKLPSVQMSGTKYAGFPLIKVTKKLLTRDSNGMFFKLKKIGTPPNGKAPKK